MQRKSWAEANCPMARSVDMIGEWGSLLIIRAACGRVRRFGRDPRAEAVVKCIFDCEVKDWCFQFKTASFLPTGHYRLRSCFSSGNLRLLRTSPAIITIVARIGLALTM